MRFDNSFLDEIRARLPVSQVVGGRVKLKRNGREFTGLSPFKDEKTPSFTVNDMKAFYHCFATGEHGDIFTFLMKTEGINFPEAVEKLAGEAGLQMPKQTPEMVEREQSRDRLGELMEASCQFYQKSLAGALGQNAARYIDGRGLSSETIATFRLGYAPNSKTALKSFLNERGFTDTEMARTGMVIHGDDIPVSYDRFRNRVMFPITDLKGRIIAYGGRALDANQPAKYLNSPETELFHKGSVLYNAARARQASYDAGMLIATEGYMDVIALAQVGINNAVAPLGTALTANQMGAMWRMTDEPVLCFDGDLAGQKAAIRAMENALPLLTAGKSLRFAFMPDGLDPDDLVRAQGPQAFHAITNATKPLVDMLWMREWGEGNWSEPEKRAALEKNLKTKIAEISDQSVRSYYDQEIRNRLFNAWRNSGRSTSMTKKPSGDDWQRRMREQNNRNNNWAKPPASSTSSLKSSPLVSGQGTQMPVRDALILKTMINHPWLIEENAEELAGLQFSTRPANELVSALLDTLSHQVTLDTDAVYDHLKSLGFDATIAIIENAITHKGDGFANLEAPRDEVETGWRHILEIHIKGTELKRELKVAERELAEGSELAWERMREIQNELHRQDS